MDIRPVEVRKLRKPQPKLSKLSDQQNNLIEPIQVVKHSISPQQNNNNNNNNLDKVQDFSRLALAAALLDYDNEDNLESDLPSAKAQTSAILSPFRHLLSPQQEINSNNLNSYFPPPSPNSDGSNPIQRSLSPASASRIQSLYGSSNNGDIIRPQSYGLDNHLSNHGDRRGSSISSNSIQGNNNEGSRFSGFQSQFGMPNEDENREELILDSTITGTSIPQMNSNRNSYHSLAANIVGGYHPTEDSNGRIHPERPRAKSLGSNESLSLSYLPPIDLSTPSLSSSIHQSPILSPSLRLNSTPSLPDLLLSSRSPNLVQSIMLNSNHSDEVLPTTTNSNRLSLNERGLKSPDSFSNFTPRFTSRFDPAMLDLARKEMEGDRAIFQSKEAGETPRTVIMPTPLAGQYSGPAKKVRTEGPDEEEVEEEVIAVEVPNLIVEPEEKDQMKEPRRPAGKLYGTSLMDVLNQKKQDNKSKSKQYVAGLDGRRSMMDWKTKEVVVNGDNHQGISEVPVEGIPGGRTLTRANQSYSVFGPDLIYQRDLERRRIMDEEEMARLEREDKAEEAMWEKERLKEEAKRSKSRNVKDAQQKLEGKAPVQRNVLRRHAPSPSVTTPSSPPPLLQDRRHTAAPSLSLPAALNDIAQPIILPLPSPDDSIISEPRYAIPTPYSPPKHSFPSRPAYNTQTSEERTSSIRMAVMMGNLSSAEAAAELRKYGEHSGTSSGNDSGLNHSEINMPPRLHIDLSNGAVDLNISSAEREDLNNLGETEYSPPVVIEVEEEEEEDDDLPLGLKYTQVDEDDDLPLGLSHPNPLIELRRSKEDEEEEEEEEDEIPLGLLNTLQQQQQQQQLHLHHQQQQIQFQQQQQQQHVHMQHAMMQQATFMQQQQHHQQQFIGQQIMMRNVGGGSVGNLFGGSENGINPNRMMGENGGGRVEQWRKGIS